MPSQVFSVSEVKRLLEQGAQLVDVLGEDEFEHDTCRAPSISR
jgi:hypothetical protein